MTSPDASRPSLDRALLAAAPPPWRVEVVDEAASTNALVGVRARAGEPEGLVVAAEHQTSGRGRLDRVWVTPAGSALTCSVLLRPAGVPVARWPWLPLLAGVATATAVRRATGVAADLKWPNDVLVGDRKLAGILVERVDTPEGPAAVVGIGLNAAMRADELPVDTATSLLLEGGRAGRTTLLLAVLEMLGELVAGWVSGAGEPSALRAAYLELCGTVGREVRVELPGGEQCRGQATGVDPDGRLVVDVDGVARQFGAGDVVHLRA